MARPREFDLDDTVRKLLYLFWQKGYEATTLRDIEQVTGLGRMSLYNMFGDKAGIFQAVLERYLASSRRLYRKLLTGNGLADLEGLIEAYAKPDYLGEAGCWGCPMLNSIAADMGVNDKVVTAIENFRQYTIDCIRGSLEDARARGEIINDVDIPELAEFILIVLWGTKLTIRHSGSAAAAEPVSKLLPMLLRGLKSGSAL